jgi:Ras-related protein Rab-1A
LFKILLLGDSGVGKSCIIIRYIENNFSTNLMNSIGVDFKLKNIQIDNKNIKLQIWDTAGQERFRTITTSYYKGAHAILIVFDLSDRESFEHVRNWMADIDKFAKEGVYRILVGNKCDLENSRKVRKEEGNEIANKYGIKYIETSAKETTNIDDLFESTAKHLLSKQINNPTLGKGTQGRKAGIDLINNNNNQNKTQSGGFCC